MVDSNNKSNSNQLVAEFNMSVLQDFSMMFMNEEFSDVKFKVQDRLFPAHKCILAQRSDYFRTLFTGNFTEKQQEVIELKEISVDDFELCLSIIYGIVPYSDLSDVARASQILGVSSFFLIEEVMTIVMGFLQKNINSDSVLKIYEQALYYSFHEVLRSCLEEITYSALKILEHEDFLHLSADALKKVISLDSLYAPEMKIFRAVQKWLEVNPFDDSKQEILDLVRLGRISQDDMLKFVWPTNLYSSDRIMQSIADSKYRPDQPGRGALVKRTDFCKGTWKNINIFNASRSFPPDFHKFRDEFNKMILMTIELKDNYIINCLELTIRNRQPGTPYFIKFHYSNLKTRNYNEVEWEDAEVTISPKYDSVKLEIEPTVIKHIIILGLQNTADKIIRILEVKCSYEDKE